MHQQKHQKSFYVIEGLAILALVLLVAFALRGNVIGNAISEGGFCKDTAAIKSCMTDNGESYLVEMNCQNGKWTRTTIPCDCQINNDSPICS